MFGLGKPRSRFGKWIDREGLTQRDIAKKAKISEMSLTRMCNDKEYVPKYSTWAKVERALRSLGYDVDRDDFFGM